MPLKVPVALRILFDDQRSSSAEYINEPILGKLFFDNKWLNFR